MSQATTHVIPVVMCGGSGSRLWPASRQSFPKQFIRLLGKQSTFQTAIQRVSNPDLFVRPLVISGNDVRFIVAEQLSEIGIAADIVLEPIQRDSAAAVAVAACYAARQHPGALVLIKAADHVISDSESFVEACRSATEAARLGYVMTLGVRPKFPATSFGYIRPAGPIANTGAFQVGQFVEKPNAEQARGYIEQGFLWNSGNFLFRADVMIEELERLEPAILGAARDAVDRAAIDLDFIRLEEQAFKLAPKKSIDYAVMERTERAGVLPVEFSWSDIGTWDALWNASPQDEYGNAVRGNVEIFSSRNSLVYSNDILTAVVGMENVVVVATADAVLVASREQTDLVKDLVSMMRTKNRAEADEHIRIYRPWGWYQRIDLGSRFRVKRILVQPGARLSLQKHFHRAEHWVVVCGTAEVTVDGRILTLHENEAAYIPIGAVHRLANPGRIPLEIIEVQVGSYTGEDDVVRLEDAYGR